MLLDSISRLSLAGDSSFICLVRNHTSEKQILWSNTHVGLLSFSKSVHTDCMHCSWVSPNGRFPHYKCNNTEMKVLPKKTFPHSSPGVFWEQLRLKKTESCTQLLIALLIGLATFQTIASSRSSSAMKWSIKDCTVYCILSNYYKISQYYSTKFQCFHQMSM